jgi:DNA primase
MPRFHGATIWCGPSLLIRLDAVPPRVADVTALLERTISLERLVAKHGLTFTRTGDILTSGCPLHVATETSSTLTIDISTNTWSCPSCRVTEGGVVSWVMKANGVSRRHAIELLQSDDLVTSAPTKAVKRITRKLVTSPFASGTPDHLLLASVTDYYHAALTRHSDPTTLLTEMALTDGDLINKFKIGICERTLAYRLPDSRTKEGGPIREQLQRLGVFRESGQETLRGCLTVPLFDSNGVVVSMYGRRVHHNVTKHPSADVFLPQAETSLWNMQVFIGATELLVFTNIYDAMIAWCSGVRGVTALHHEKSIELLIEQVKANRTKQVTFVSSVIEGTHDGSKKQAARLVEEVPGVEVFEANLPGSKGLKGLVGTPGGIAGGLTAILRKSTWVGGLKVAAKPALVRFVAEDPKVSASPSPSSPPAPETTALRESTSTTPTTSPSPTISCGDHDISIVLGDRKWRVRGLDRNTSYASMKVNIHVVIERPDPRLCGFHVDVVELYSARQRTAFVTAASEELGISTDVIKRDLGLVLLQLEELQDRLIKAERQPKEVRPEMSGGDRAAALELLHDPHLLDRVVADLDRCGVVGEVSNKIVGYLAATSRLLDEPLALLVQSSSAAGKSSLMDAILNFVPEEDRVSFSAMTGQALYYVVPGSLRHKVLSIAEEEGASRASYALKLLQSEGRLTIASTAKEAGTGRMTTHEYAVEGPVALMLTTTSTQVDPELENRCIVLAVDEGQEQTSKIHVRQRDRETLDGILARRDREAVLNLHRNAQRLLRARVVVNPYVHELVFPVGTTRARRDHRKYLTLIKTVTLLFQYQREIRKIEHNGVIVEYIETTTADIKVADGLVTQLFGDPGNDLPPHTRELLRRLEDLVVGECLARGLDRRDYRFTRREVRERLGVGGTQLWTHLRRLVDAEHLIVHPSRRGRGVVYEMVGEHPDPATTATSEGERSGDVRGGFGPNSGQIRGSESTTSSEKNQGEVDHRSGSAEENHRTSGSKPSRHDISTLNGVG